MTTPDLKRLLHDITSVRVGIVGDFCLDVYWFLDPPAGEASLETGLSTLPVSRQQYTLGGAGNIAVNLRAMGVRHVSTFGVVGRDPFGPFMLSVMAESGIQTACMRTQGSDWSTHVYTKPHIGEREQQRIDFGDFNRLHDDIAGALLGDLQRETALLDVVVVNEQVRSGIHASDLFRDGLDALIAAQPEKLFILDSRHLGEAYSGAIKKLNDREAARLCGLLSSPDQRITADDTRIAAEKLRQRWARPLFITRGERGCIVSDDTGLHEIPGMHIVQPVDPVGAGDSVLAGMAAALGSGRDCVTAATCGNFVAGVTVQKLFLTGTASPEEILAIGAEPDYVYNADLAEMPARARTITGSDIEIVTERPASLLFSTAIFDHDGTISVLRQGWESIMEPLMIRQILGPLWGKADEDLNARVRDRVRDFIDKTTGIQTITQMDGLRQIVLDFRLIPPDQVLDAAGYKRIYDEELDRLVETRLQKLMRGELTPEDWTIKGAIPFLEALSHHGVVLYLASGSDHDDVQKEAGALGYAHLFADRIFGSVGIPERDAKKIVLEKILTSLGTDTARHLIVFGDGPVEIRETHKAGGFSVGVASDEVRRFGLNLPKRSRLIRAGADLVIPDFSQREILLETLHFTGR